VGRQRGITKQQKETSGSIGYVHYFNYGDVSTYYKN
jgi:hypothetical protein